MKKLSSLAWNIRKVVFLLHQIFGLILGLAFGLLGLSGSILVFGDTWDKALHPHLLQISNIENQSTLPARVIWEQLQQHYPKQAIQRIRFPKNATSPYEICFPGKELQCVYLDPYRNQILGARVPDQSLKRQLFLLHSHLLNGDPGEAVIGILGILLLVMGISGLWLWWPLKRLKEAAARLPQENPWTQPSYRLHRWMGFVVCGFLVLTSFTGASMAFEKPMEHFLNWICHSPDRPKPPKIRSSGSNSEFFASLTDYVEAANQSLPGGEVTMVTWPKKSDDTIVVRKKMPGEWHPNGRSFVYLDPATAKVLLIEDARQATLGTKIRNLFYPLHTGAWGGMGTQILQFVVGLSPLVLFISSLLMWRNRRRYLRGIKK